MKQDCETLASQVNRSALNTYPNVCAQTWDSSSYKFRMESDPHWKAIQEAAAAAAAGEPALLPVFEKAILNATCLECCLSILLSQKLIIINGQENYLQKVFEDAFAHDRSIGEAVRADLVAVCERDPACNDLLTPLMYFKGFQALTAHRMAHYLWQNNRRILALHLQSLVSQIFSVDIHPAAQFGKGILLDHATSFVAGETTVVEDDVSILHEVTLGGTGKERGLRHPYIESGVLIGAGAKILGRIRVGRCAKIGANSVVLTDVPEHTSVAGVPAKVVGKASEFNPALGMNHSI
jgi:serine O-acetyltransferase